MHRSGREQNPPMVVAEVCSTMKYPKRCQYKHAKRKQYHVRNWAEYNDGLRRRGDLTVWFDEEAIANWKADKTGKPGGQRLYSDMAIETSLVVRMVYKLAYRQTEGFLHSIASLLGLGIEIPDYSTLCRRSRLLRKNNTTKNGTPSCRGLLRADPRPPWHAARRVLLLARRRSSGLLVPKAAAWPGGSAGGAPPPRSRPVPARGSRKRRPDVRAQAGIRLSRCRRVLFRRLTTGIIGELTRGKRSPVKVTTRSVPSWILCSLLVAAVAPAALARAQAATEHRWLDAKGNPLPFQDDASILEFLRTADVVSERDIGVGINQSKRLLLEKDGVRAHAIFREADRREDSARIKGKRYRLFADSYLFEPAAYELAKILELRSIPPVVVRNVGRRQGSAQIWLENTLDEKGDDFQPPSPLAWVQQMWDMFFFDNLIYNIDRNAGNVLVSADYTLWMIDHTRAFQFKNELLDEHVTKMRRRTWERLVALTEDELRRRLSGYLTPVEFGSLWKRRRLFIEHVNRLVEERGEAVVFYE